MDSRTENRDNQSKANPKLHTAAEKQTKAVRPKRERFEEPRGWKEEAERSVTLATVIPSVIGEKERLQKPNFSKLKADVETCDKEIERLYNRIEQLNNERKKKRTEAKTGGSQLREELRRLIGIRKTHTGALVENKALKTTYADKLARLDEQLRQAEKKSSTGKIVRKKDLLESIKAKEDEFNNTMKTATEEKRMNDEITKLKAMLKSLPEAEKLREESQRCTEMIKEVGRKNKEEFEKLKKVDAEIDALKSRIGSQKTAQHDEQQEKPAKGISDEFEAKKEQHLEEIRKLKVKRQALRDRFDCEQLACDKQHFEINKTRFMQGVQRRLKAEANKVVREQELTRQKLDEGEKAKAQRQFMFSEEIDTCERLISLLTEMKEGNQAKKESLEGREAVHHVVNKDVLEKEGLVLVVSKKQEGGLAGTKKKNKSPLSGKKAELMPVSGKHKLSIHVDALGMFHGVRVVAPTTRDQIDATIAILTSKINYYLEQRTKDDETQDDNKTACQLSDNTKAVLKDRIDSMLHTNNSKIRGQKSQPLEEDFPALESIA